MPEATDRTIDMENLLDTVEDLVEAGREMLRAKSVLRTHQKFVEELAGETKALIAQLETGPASGKPAATAPAHMRRKRGEPAPPFDRISLANNRKRLRLSQAALGTKVGVTGPHICNIEKGSAIPSSELLQRIQAALAMKEGA